MENVMSSPLLALSHSQASCDDHHLSYKGNSNYDNVHQVKYEFPGESFLRKVLLKTAFLVVLHAHACAFPTTI
jgi:hypothetical protein